MKTSLARGFAVLFVLCTPAAWAATFCVGNAVQLQSALDTAATNGQSDTIRILVGTIAGGRVFQSGEPHDISVRGGYTAGCLQTSSTWTVLDGQGVTRPLRIINDNGDIAVERITFVDGLSTNNRGGGLSVDSINGDVRVELNRFLYNRADDRAGGLRAGSTSGRLTIRNNLFYLNSAAAGGAVELFQDGGVAFVTSNTILGNTADSGAPNVAGLLISGTATFVLYNNIVWGNTVNGALDLYVYGTVSHGRVSNDIGDVGGPGASPFLLQNEQNVAPDFLPCDFPCLSFELNRGSPLVDAGVNEPAGDLSTVDLTGKPRIIGPQVDIGAYENERLFANGFE